MISCVVAFGNWFSARQAYYTTFILSVFGLLLSLVRKVSQFFATIVLSSSTDCGALTVSIWEIFVFAKTYDELLRWWS